MIINGKVICPNVQFPKVNSCLIIKYDNGKDFIQPHRDTEYSFGQNPTIINLSIGSTRTFVVTSNDTQDEYEMELEDNSILIMCGGSQKYFVHGIPECDELETRYSLTFREYGPIPAASKRIAKEG